MCEFEIKATGVTPYRKTTMDPDFDIKLKNICRVQETLFKFCIIYYLLISVLFLFLGRVLFTCGFSCDSIFV